MTQDLLPTVAAIAGPIITWFVEHGTYLVLSFGFIFLVLVAISLVYRAGASDERLDKAVTLTFEMDTQDNTIEFGPRHFQDRTVHFGRAPRVQFFAIIPNQPLDKYLAADLPLKVKIRDRNSANVYDHSYKREPDNGGQVAIDEKTRNQIDKYAVELFRREGRRLYADTDRFMIRLKYPMSANVMYLLRDHPDASVRIGAWVFVLGAFFSTAQTLISERPARSLDSAQEESVRPGSPRAQQHAAIVSDESVSDGASLISQPLDR